MKGMKKEAKAERENNLKISSKMKLIRCTWWHPNSDNGILISRFFFIIIVKA